jgi:acetyl esterase/lipase
VVVFAHGGGWTSGDKADQGAFGVFLARHGIGVAAINYRLWPGAGFPAAAEDLAQAFAWVRDHAPAFGGDPNQVYLCGHSAGGHSAALVATDTSFLKAEGIDLRDVRGVITLSAVYDLHWNVTLYGAGPVFRGADRAQASPLRRVGPGSPPFLIVYAQREIWTLASQARRFHKRLVGHGCRSQLVFARGACHSSIVSDVAFQGAGAGGEIVQFVLGDDADSICGPENGIYRMPSRVVA